MKADLATSTEQLYKIFKKIWEEEQIPKDWEEGTIIKIKKKGDSTICDNWRGITLLSIPSKILGRIIIERISTALDKQLRKEQAGFRRGRGCAQQIFTLKNIIEQSKEWNSTLYINFIDFQKAFDSVHQDTLWILLKEYGIKEKIINIIKRLYKDFRCTVAHNGQSTEPFEIRSGVRQGCPMSGFLFLLIVDWTMREATRVKRGIRWGLMDRLEDLDFADDIALLSESRKEMQDKTNEVNRIAEKCGLKINTAKTKVMRINASSERRITIHGEEIEEVERFRYLGATLDSDGGTSAEIKNRMQAAGTAFRKLNSIWRSGVYSIRTKLKIFRSNVTSILLYDSENWKITKAEQNKLEAFQNKCLRRILRVFWPNTISNKVLLERTQMSSVEVQIRKRRWTWIGHILRRERKEDARVALKWTPPGRRNRGRPKTTWRRMAEKERNGYGWRSWEVVAAAENDRGRWRDFVSALCATRLEEDK